MKGFALLSEKLRLYSPNKSLTATYVNGISRIKRTKASTFQRCIMGQPSWNFIKSGIGSCFPLGYAIDRTYLLIINCTSYFVSLAVDSTGKSIAEILQWIIKHYFDFLLHRNAAGRNSLNLYLFFSPESKAASNQILYTSVRNELTALINQPFFFPPFLMFIAY